MKIGLVRRGYSGSGGAEAYLLRFADAACAAGHEPVLFSGEEWPNDVWDYHHVRLAGSRSPRLFADAVKEKATGACDFLFSLERIHECDAYRAGDGVHAEWLTRRRAFEPKWKGWFRRWQRKHQEILELECGLFTGGARVVIANSRMVKDEIIARFATPPERIHVAYNGAPKSDDDPALRTSTRERLGLGESDYAVLFAGSGWERKGLIHAIEAIDLLPPPATLLVAGKGKSGNLPPSECVRFLGPQPEMEMRALLAAADAFVLPTFYEPFSNACLEALAAGLPVITTTANGFAEIIEPGVEGEVVPPGDSTALAEALARWSDPQKRAGIRARLRAKGATYSIEGNLRRTLEVIAGVGEGNDE